MVLLVCIFFVAAIVTFLRKNTVVVKPANEAAALIYRSNICQPSEGITADEINGVIKSTLLYQTHIDYLSLAAALVGTLCCVTLLVNAPQDA